MNGIQYLILSGSFYVTGAMVDFALFHSSIGGMDFVIVTAPRPNENFRPEVLRALDNAVYRVQPVRGQYRIVWIDDLEPALIENGDKGIWITKP